MLFHRPDHFESWKIAHDKPRDPAVEVHGVYVANKKDPAGNYGSKFCSSHVVSMCMCMCIHCYPS